MIKFNKYGQCEDNPHEWEDELKNRTTCKICGSIRLNSESLNEILEDENSKEIYAPLTNEDLVEMDIGKYWKIGTFFTKSSLGKNEDIERIYNVPMQ